MPTQTILFDGKPYVILPREEYDRLNTLAKAAALPPLPARTADGNYPALEYARGSLARKIIQARSAAGLSQRQLALQAGVRVETLCRIETGKHTPSVTTIEKIEHVLKQAASAHPKRAKPRVQKRQRDARKSRGNNTGSSRAT